jgi:hypothetical protein
VSFSSGFVRDQSSGALVVSGLADGGGLSLASLFQGAYSAGTTYQTGQLVTAGGSTYLSLIDGNLGNSVSDTSKWGLLARSGAVASEALTAPSGIVAETIARTGTGLANVAALTSGTLQLTSVGLMAGQVVSTCKVMAGTQLAVTPTNQWVALIRLSDLAVLGKTADLTTAAWAASAFQTFTFSPSITIASDGAYAVGLLVVAATPPSLRGIANTGAISNQVPQSSGKSNTGLTTPAGLGANAAAITTDGNGFYAVLA